jgi:hypothetical protein
MGCVNITGAVAYHYKWRAEFLVRCGAYGKRLERISL